jgi:RNA polymerase sigma-70 factor, ECF subfamily
MSAEVDVGALYRFYRRKPFQTGVRPTNILMMFDDEQQLLSRVREQDPTAFQLLVDRYKKQIYYLGLDLTGNHHDAEDLAQDVFLKAFQSIHNFRGDSRISSWLHRIAVNTHIDSRRKKSTNMTTSYDDPEDDPGRFAAPVDSPAHNPHRNVEANRVQQDIEFALQALTPRERMVFVLRHYQDLALKEIAEAMDVSEGTVKSFLFRAIKKLQKSLAIHATQTDGRSSI